MKELTKAEDQVMQILWKLKKGVVNDIIDQFPNPKPAYNTVSTVVRILEKKGFVDHKSYGKTHEYYPVIEQETYTKKFLQNFAKSYFNSSFSQLISFFAKDKDISINDLEEIKTMIEKEMQKKSKNNDELS